MLENRSCLGLRGRLSQSALAVFIGGALLLSGCNGRSGIEGTIGGFDLGEAKFAFFGKAEGLGLDLDGNDTPDATATLVVVLTDKRSFCRDMENLSIVEDLEKLGDAQLLVVNADLFAADAEKSPLKGGVVVQQGDTIDVALRYQAFADSAQAATAANASDDVVLNVKRINFERLVGSLTGTLVDAGADVVINGNFVANHCPGLDSAALTGGL